MERYRWIESEAEAFEEFMLPMLEWDQEARATAEEILKSKWLSTSKVGEFKMSEKQHSAYLLKNKLLNIDKNDDASYLTFIDESIKDAEADCESTKSEESESDFEIEEEKYLWSWRTKRNMAEGFQLNNSFTGPYPDDHHGLHVDWGFNYQF